MKLTNFANKIVIKSFNRSFSNIIASLTQASISGTGSFFNMPFSHEFLTQVNNQSKTDERQELDNHKKNHDVSMKHSKYILFTGKIHHYNLPLVRRSHIPDLEETIITETPINKNSIKIPEKEEQIEINFKARNNRIPSQSNHGARPCSSFMRRLRLKKILNRGKMKTKDEL